MGRCIIRTSNEFTLSSEESFDFLWNRHNTFCFRSPCTPVEPLQFRVVCVLLYYNCCWFTLLAFCFIRDQMGAQIHMREFLRWDMRVTATLCHGNKFSSLPAKSPIILIRHVICSLCHWSYCTTSETLTLKIRQ